MYLLFYPSKTNDRLNARPFNPERIVGRIMVNPHYRVKVVGDAKVICDSGAFQDIDRVTRLTPEQALEKQLSYENNLRLSDHAFNYFESICIYDQMIGVDEQLIDGKKVKMRGTHQTALKAIRETLLAAEYYASRRTSIEGKICFVGQGIDPRQYIDRCIVPMLDLIRPKDFFAFGGFCIIGRVPSLKPVFYQTFQEAMPLLKKAGVARIHLLGVLVSDVVTWATVEAKKYGIAISNDGAGPEMNGGAFGRIWRDGKYEPIGKKKWIEYHPHDVAIHNIAAYNDWCASL